MNENENGFEQYPPVHFPWGLGGHNHFESSSCNYKVGYRGSPVSTGWTR